jgi:hypothetical protein
MLPTTNPQLSEQEFKAASFMVLLACAVGIEYCYTIYSCSRTPLKRYKAV